MPGEDLLVDRVKLRCQSIKVFEERIEGDPRFPRQNLCVRRLHVEERQQALAPYTPFEDEMSAASTP